MHTSSTNPINNIKKEYKYFSPVVFNLGYAGTA
jgi:hypothetical protein